MASRSMFAGISRHVAAKQSGQAARSAAAGPSRLASSSATRLQTAEAPSAGVDAGPEFGENVAPLQRPNSNLMQDQGRTAETKPPKTSQPSVLEDTLVHPRTHNHHVATLHLRAYGLPVQVQNLVFFSDFAMRVGYALGIPLSRPAALPVRKSLYTVLKSPFVHKKAQENFERRTHKRVIKAFDADPQVIERWLQFLRIHSMGGLGMRVERFRQLPLGIGAELLEASTAALRQVPSAEGRAAQDSAIPLRSREPDSDTVARLAEEFVREEMANFQEEERAAATNRDVQAVDSQTDAPEASSEQADEAITGDNKE